MTIRYVKDSGEPHQNVRHDIALDGATFTVAHGEVFGLLGPNGAGKPDIGNDIHSDRGNSKG